MSAPQVAEIWRSDDPGGFRLTRPHERGDAPVDTSHGIEVHRPSEPVTESGKYAALNPAGRLLAQAYLPAGTFFPPASVIGGGENTVKYVPIQTGLY
jgi:hypothetical protein